MVHLDPARAVGAAADLLAPPPPGPFVSHAGPDAVPPIALPRSRALGARTTSPTSSTPTTPACESMRTLRGLGLASLASRSRESLVSEEADARTRTGDPFITRDITEGHQSRFARAPIAEDANGKSRTTANDYVGEGMRYSAYPSAGLSAGSSKSTLKFPYRDNPAS